MMDNTLANVDLMANQNQAETVGAAGFVNGEGGDVGHEEGMGLMAGQNEEGSYGVVINQGGYVSVGDGHVDKIVKQEGVDTFGFADIGEMSVGVGSSQAGNLGLMANQQAPEAGGTAVMGSDSGEAGLGVRAAENEMTKTSGFVKEVVVGPGPTSKTRKDDAAFVHPMGMRAPPRLKPSTAVPPQVGPCGHYCQHEYANATYPGIWQPGNEPPKVIADGTFYCHCGLQFSITVKSFHPPVPMNYYANWNNETAEEVNMDESNAGAAGMEDYAEDEAPSVPEPEVITRTLQDVVQETVNEIMVKTKGKPKKKTAPAETATSSASTSKPVERTSTVGRPSMKAKRTKANVIQHGFDIENQRVVASGKFYCYCGSEFSTLACLKAHIKYFVEEWQFICQQCSKKFYSASFLRKHMMTAHGIDMGPGIGCMKCGGLFPSYKDMMDHKRDNKDCGLQKGLSPFKKPKTEGNI